MKPAKWIIIILIAIIVIGLGILLRNKLVQVVFKKVSTVVKYEYHLNLQANDIRFKGITGVELKGLNILTESDTLLNAKHCELFLSFPALLTGHINFNCLKIDSAVVSVYRLPERNNLSFLSGRKNSSNRNSTSYQETFEKANDRWNRLMSVELEISNTSFHYIDSVRKEDLYIPSFSCNGNKLDGSVIDENTFDTLHIGGKCIRKDKEWHFSVTHNNSAFANLPFLKSASGTKMRFKNLDIAVCTNDENSNLECAVKIKADALYLYHWRLASNEICLNTFNADLLFRARDQSIELDSSSTLTVNGLTGSLFLQYQRKPDSIFTLMVSIPPVTADSFFRCLPMGLFTTFNNIDCSGSLGYNLFFRLPLHQPDSLVFISNPIRKNLRIVKFGTENYARINQPFVYKAYAGKQFMRNLVVGPENPFFTPLGNISPYLIHSVLQSEDPSFMTHRGFIVDAFKESIATDYKEHRFVRGGSTISMQLVKNVFLSREKTVARKAEEALIVYFIENLGLAPKERMLEVYLNVIEWGPNIYGIGEAAKFYFNKKPSELNLKESIFLAGIIPVPRWYKQQFDNTGTLRPYFASYFSLLASRMLSHGWISESDTIGLKPDVKLKGQALNFISPETGPAPEPDGILQPEDDN